MWRASDPAAILAARIFPRTAVTWLAEGVRFAAAREPAASRRKRPSGKTSCGLLAYDRLECPVRRIGRGGSAGILSTWKSAVALGKEGC